MAAFIAACVRFSEELPPQNLSRAETKPQRKGRKVAKAQRGKGMLTKLHHVTTTPVCTSRKTFAPFAPLREVFSTRD